MEKGHSGRKQRENPEQCGLASLLRQPGPRQPSAAKPCPCQHLIILNAPSALLAWAPLPASAHRSLGWWVVPWYFLAWDVKQTQWRRQMERAASIQLTPGIPPQYLSLTTQVLTVFCTLNETKAGGCGMKELFQHPHGLQRPKPGCESYPNIVLCTAWNNQSYKPLMKKKALSFHGVSSSSLNHNNSSSDHSVLIYWISHVCKSYFFSASSLLHEPKGQRCSPGTKLALINRNKQPRNYRQPSLSHLFHSCKQHYLFSPVHYSSSLRSPKRGRTHGAGSSFYGAGGQAGRNWQPITGDLWKRLKSPVHSVSWPSQWECRGFFGTENPPFFRVQLFFQEDWALEIMLKN